VEGGDGDEAGNTLEKGCLMNENPNDDEDPAVTLMFADQARFGNLYDDDTTNDYIVPEEHAAVLAKAQQGSKSRPHRGIAMRGRAGLRHTNPKVKASNDDVYRALQNAKRRFSGCDGAYFSGPWGPHSPTFAGYGMRPPRNTRVQQTGQVIFFNGSGGPESTGGPLTDDSPTNRSNNHSRPRTQNSERPAPWIRSARGVGGGRGGANSKAQLRRGQSVKLPKASHSRADL
jgi:hypothetical protein